MNGEVRVSRNPYCLVLHWSSNNRFLVNLAQCMAFKLYVFIVAQIAQGAQPVLFRLQSQICP